MEVSLERHFPEPTLPDDFDFVPWSDHELVRHAEVHHACFAEDTDALVFPIFSSPMGTLELMRTIRAHPGFCKAATWLISVLKPGGGRGAVGTVQGVIESGRLGALQNIGVAPEYRGRGLGTALLLRCMAGFRAQGARRVCLEVTAEKVAAMRFYRRFGFRPVRAVYRPLPGRSGRPVSTDV